MVQRRGGAECGLYDEPPSPRTPPAIASGCSSSMSPGNGFLGGAKLDGAAGGPLMSAVATNSRAVLILHHQPQSALAEKEHNERKKGSTQHSLPRGPRARGVQACRSIVREKQLVVRPLHVAALGLGHGRDKVFPATQKGGRGVSPYRPEEDGRRRAASGRV